MRLGLVALPAVLALGGMASAATIRLGAILPLTGPGGVVGTQQVRGIQFAMNAAN